MTTISSNPQISNIAARLNQLLEQQANAGKAEKATAPNEQNADLAANALANAGPQGQVRSTALARTAPVLSTPTAPEPEAGALSTLQAALGTEGTSPEPLAAFMQAVLREVGEQELQGLRTADAPSSRASEAGSAPASLRSAAAENAPASPQDAEAHNVPTLPMALQEQFKSLIGLQSHDGELVFPTVKAREVVSGLITPTTDGQEALGELLSDTPGINSILDEAKGMNDEELSVRMNADPRFAFVLMLIAFLMKLAASQREQAAGMLIFAEKSVHDMGERMVDSAKQQQLAKVVALVVVVVVSTVAVGVGATAANRNISSIKTNQRTVNSLNEKSAKNEVNLASGTNDAGGKVTPMSFSERLKVRQQIAEDQKQAAVMSTKHQQNLNTTSVISQTGQTLGQAGSAAGAAAGSGHEIQAADLTAQQEKRRADANAGQQINQAIGQNTTKVDESSQALFRQAQQAEQEKADARNAITNNIGK